MALRFLNSGYFAGKVGIGTDSPDAQLDIGANNIITLDDTGSSTGFIGFGSYNNGTINRAQGASYYGFGLEIDRPNQLISFKSYDSTGATNSGVGILTLKRDGNVGLGTNSPGSLLEIKKGVQGGLTLPLTINPGFYQAGSSSGIGFLTDGNTSYTKGALVYTTNGTGWNIGDFQFLLRNDGNTNLVTLADAKMTIKASGKVGIGTSTPSANLYVSGSNADATDKPTMMSESVFTIKPVALNSGNLNFAQVDGGNSIGMQYTNGAGTANWDISMQPFGGNVGIGTVSPLGRLQVNEYTVASQGNQGDHGELSVFANSGDDSLFLGIKDAAYPNRGWSFNPVTNGVNSNLQFKEHGSTSVRMTIESGGSVGINTTSPDFKLDVDGTFGVSDLPGNLTSTSALVANEITGPELITNGDFENGGTSWNGSQTSPATVTFSGGKATIVSPNGESAYRQQSILVPTNTYKATVDIVVRSGSAKLQWGTGTNASSSVMSATGSYVFYKTIPATNANALFYIARNGACDVDFDNVSVKQITSASNQIQKRELGTGAFGPTPVGAYLPLTAGSGFPLTGHLFIDTPAGASQSGYALKLNKTNSSSVVQVGAEIFATPWASNTNGGNIIFKNADSATNLQETLRISANGSVGINSTSSSFKLDVGGNSRFQDSVYIDTSTGSGGLYVTRLGSASESVKIYTTDSTSVFETFQDENTGGYGSMAFVLDNGAPNPDFSFKYGSQVRLKIEGGTGDVILGDALLSSQEDTDIDTGVGIVAKVVHATYTAAFFDFVIKKGTNVRSGTVYACHNGDTTPLVEFTETSTNDLGDTSDVTLSVNISGAYMRLLATVTSDDWSVKSLIRAI